MVNETGSRPAPADDKPDYGIRTCGKLLDKPFDQLGPCLLPPEHDDVCMVKAPGMSQGVLMNVKKVPYESPFDTDELVLKYRRWSRKTFHISLMVAAVNIAACAWSLLSLFEVL